jgi:hypothetical protein
VSATQHFPAKACRNLIRGVHQSLQKMRPDMLQRVLHHSFPLWRRQTARRAVLHHGNALRSLDIKYE